MNKRQESINKLKEAIKNKKLGMYQDDVHGCRYYDVESKTKCAVGYLMDNEFIENNKEDDGNCILEGSIDNVLKSNNWNNITGLTDDELKELQRLHDKVISNDIIPKYKLVNAFENYVNQL